MAHEADIPDEAPAVFVSYLPSGFSEAETEAKLYELVWATEREHSVLCLASGRRALVYGGRLGIILHVIEQVIDGRSAAHAFIEIEAALHRVVRLEVHVHPKPTGPSPGDFRVLDLLGQNESVLYEMWGGRTVFRRKAHRSKP